MCAYLSPIQSAWEWDWISDIPGDIALFRDNLTQTRSKNYWEGSFGWQIHPLCQGFLLSDHCFGRSSSTGTQKIRYDWDHLSFSAPQELIKANHYPRLTFFASPYPCFPMVVIFMSRLPLAKKSKILWKKTWQNTTYGIRGLHHLGLSFPFRPEDVRIYYHQAGQHKA